MKNLLEKIGQALVVTGLLVIFSPTALAQMTQAQVVTAYLAGLSNGDTQSLISLIDGRMKRKSKQLFSDPESYSAYLKQQYANVSMTLENVAASGKRTKATVRFDYPAGNTANIDFILSMVDGEWKITDEDSDD